MKILERKNGHIDNVFPMKCKCHYQKDGYNLRYGDAKDYCGSELEIDASDIVKHPYSKYPYISGDDYGYICPVCKHFIPIDIKNIPVEVLHNAPEISVVNGIFRCFVHRKDSDVRYPDLKSETYDNKPKFDEHSIIKQFHDKINKHFGTNILWDENDLNGSYERFMNNFIIRTRDEAMKIYNSPDHLLDSRLKSIGVSFYKCMYDHTEPHAYVIYEPDNIFTNPNTKKSENDEYVMVLIKKDFVKKAVADNYYVNESLIHLDKMESRDIIESIEWMLQNSSAELSEHTNIIATNISLFDISDKKLIIGHYRPEII